MHAGPPSSEGFQWLTKHTVPAQWDVEKYHWVWESPSPNASGGWCKPWLAYSESHGVRTCMCLEGLAPQHAFYSPPSFHSLVLLFLSHMSWPQPPKHIVRLYSFVLASASGVTEAKREATCEPVTALRKGRNPSLMQCYERGKKELLLWGSNLKIRQKPWKKGSQNNQIHDELSQNRQQMKKAQSRKADLLGFSLSSHSSLLCDCEGLMQMLEQWLNHPKLGFQKTLTKGLKMELSWLRDSL